MVFLGNSSDAEGLGNWRNRLYCTVQDLASHVCHRLLKSSISPENWQLRGILSGDGSLRCIEGSSPSPSGVRKGALATVPEYASELPPKETDHNELLRAVRDTQIVLVTAIDSFTQLRRTT